MLLATADEADFTAWIRGRARQHEWRGVHTRKSQDVLESIHTLRWDGFSEAYGVPDWLFWHERLEQSFWAELKGVRGHLSRYQKLEIPSLRRGGQVVFVWFPRDAVQADRIFQYGLDAA